MNIGKQQIKDAATEDLKIAGLMPKQSAILRAVERDGFLSLAIIAIQEVPRGKLATLLGSFQP